MNSPRLEIRQVQCADLDELSTRVAGMGYRMDRTQLGPGRSSCGIRMARSAPLACIVESTGVAFQNRASTPPGRLTFGVILRGDRPARYAGMRQGHGHVRVVPPNTEVDVVSPAAQVGAHLSFDEGWFTRFCDAAGLPGAALASSTEPQVFENPEVAQRIRELVAATFRADAETRRDPIPWAEAFAAVLVDGLHPVPTDLPRSRRRHAPTARYVRRAQEYVDAHLGEPIRLSGLCEHVGVGLRTLQRAFQEQVGLTPMDYVHVRRLGAARRLLRTTVPRRLTAAAAARDCGLNHPGRFSASYGALFGGYPSDTIRATGIPTAG